MLWVVFAFLTLVAIGILAYPLVMRTGRELPERIDFDVAVYRSQLDELTQEVESGLLTEDQATAARAEIHRRMLAAEDAERRQAAEPARTSGKRTRSTVVAVIAIILPLGAGVLYAALGSPNLSGEPYAWRERHDQSLIATSSADDLANALREHPSIAGYKRLANLYFAARQYDKAAAADHRAIDLGGDDASTWSEFGESIVMANGGSVLPQALVAFINAVDLDPHDARARFYIGLAEAQIGNLKEAVAIWRDLETGADPNAPWFSMVRDHIAALAKQGGFDPNSVAPKPPSVAALRSAVTAMSGAMGQRRSAAMPMSPPTTGTSPPPTTTAAAGADAQMDMIRTMVAKLADRMTKNPSDVAGWQRLAHAYNVLGQYDRAQAAIAHAIKLKPNDVGVLTVLAETQKNMAGPGNDTPDAFILTLRKVLTLDPTNAQALYYVGLVEQKAGHVAQARAMWTKALMSAPANDPLTDQIRSRLDATKP